MRRTRAKEKRTKSQRPGFTARTARLLLDSWVKALKPGQARKHVLTIGRRAYTPQEILREVKSGSSVGVRLVNSLIRFRQLKPNSR